MLFFINVLLSLKVESVLNHRFFYVKLSLIIQFKSWKRKKKYYLKSFLDQVKWGDNNNSVRFKCDHWNQTAVESWAERKIYLSPLIGWNKTVERTITTIKISIEFLEYYQHHKTNLLLHTSALKFFIVYNFCRIIFRKIKCSF